MVKLALDTVPHGATVTDVSTGKALPGKTPLTTTLPGAKGTRQYAFHLRGYGDAIVELPLDREAINYVETLVKGASTSTPVVHVVSDATLKAMPPIGGTGSAAKPDTKPNTGSAAVTHPDTGSAAHPDTKPDTGSAATHPDTGSATPKKDPCMDEDAVTDPKCLKNMPKDMGSAAK